MLLGAIAGDIVGSAFEHARQKSVDFPLFPLGSQFTDDTILTVAVADALLSDRRYGDAIRRWALRYPGAGYGSAFRRWMLYPGAGPYGSFGNGSAMRVSAVGWAFDATEDVLNEAKRSAQPTHDHPEGVKGAQAVALAILRARKGTPKQEIRREIASRFGYDLSRTVEQIRPAYGFDSSCQGSVPEAIIAFLDSADWEQAVRFAVSLGGDADTLAAIAGSIAEAYYEGVPPEIARTALGFLPPEVLEILERFAAAIERS
jgi:ADP-ribosylglycohydrolase